MADAKWEGRMAKEVYRKAGNRALLIAAEAELGEANKTVPFEESTLEKSGATSQDPQKLLAAISYDTAYARVQHEKLELRHDPGRRAKWLERTLEEDERDIRDLIADEIEREVP